MKINVFKIPKKNIADLKQKIQKLEMSNKHTDTTTDGWVCTFYLSTKTEVSDIAWVKDYETTVDGLDDVKNDIYYAVYICTKGDDCFALTYGKSHFYVRPFCDHDFGLDLAARIANEADVKQTATRRFSGKKKREIKSYAKNTSLSSESGESTDYIEAGVITNSETFGDRCKFGASTIISREDLTVSNLNEVFNEILAELKKGERFKIPKTAEIKDSAKIITLKNQLLEQIISDFSTLETEDSSFDLVGTDFYFHNNQKYEFKYYGKSSGQIDTMSHTALQKFLDDNNIDYQKLLGVRIEITDDTQKTYSKSLYEMIEYSVPNENIVLDNGKWKEFNEVYLDQINESVDAIEILPTETEFTKITLGEPEFNDSQELKDKGYVNADTDFSKINIGSEYSIEAWDLQKDEVVYAVKFGTPQKLVYVCAQATNTLELIRNNVNLNKLDNPPAIYCLWLGLARNNMPAKLSEINSIILKQQLDMFARKCREIGIKPTIKLSQKLYVKK